MLLVAVPFCCDFMWNNWKIFGQISKLQRVMILQCGSPFHSVPMIHSKNHSVRSFEASLLVLLWWQVQQTLQFQHRVTIFRHLLFNYTVISFSYEVNELLICLIRKSNEITEAFERCKKIVLEDIFGKPRPMVFAQIIKKRQKSLVCW